MHKRPKFKQTTSFTTAHKEIQVTSTSHVKLVTITYNQNKFCLQGRSGNYAFEIAKQVPYNR